MKGALKGPASEALEAWWADNGSNPPPVWSTLQNPEKAAILLALLREQKFVCIYCGAAISMAWRSAHIDHFWPSSKFPMRRFDWSNLVASCGPAMERRQPRICGDAKGDWVPANYVDPSDPNCEFRFAYNGLGQIMPSAHGGSSATMMIDQLKLDHESLDYQRGQIVAFLENEIATGAVDASNVAVEITAWRTPDADGRLKAFGHVAARYLEDEPI